MSRAGIAHVFNFYDTLSLARKAFPDLENHKLDTLISTFNLADGPQTHRAADDVECTQKLFVLCIGELLEQKEAELAERRAKRNASSAPAAPAPAEPEPQPEASAEPTFDEILAEFSWLK